MNSFFAQIVIVVALVAVAVAFPTAAHTVTTNKTVCWAWCGAGTCTLVWNGYWSSTCEGSCTGFICVCNAKLYGGTVTCSCSPIGGF